MTDDPTPTAGGPAPPNGDDRWFWIDDRGKVHVDRFGDVVDLLIVAEGGQVTYYPHKPGEPPKADQPAA